MISAIVLVLILIFVTITLVNNETTKTMNEDISKTKQLYSDSKAVIYYSTTIDYDFNSVVSFVSKDNTVKGYKMDGLELGSTTYNDKNKMILLEDKNSLKFVSNQGIETKSFENPEHTGISTGYLSKNNTFYSLNNTGIQDYNGPKYYSTIHYGNPDMIDLKTIEEWVQASADNGKDTIFSFVNYTGKNSENRYRLVQSKLDDTNTFNTTTIDNFKEFNDLNEVSLMSNFVYKNGILYNIISTENKQKELNYSLFEYDLKKKKLSLKPISDYDNLALAVLNPTQPLVLLGENIYFVSEEGDVHQLNITTLDAKILYTINKDFPLINIKNDKLYVYYQKEKDYFLDTLDLLTGKTMESNKLEGMDDALNKGENLSSYHLLILE